ncbi:hypothetical protein HanXRQr2_Chr12g0527651 [Helianthus annuus]|uniref:Uncharacterized protein n=1 Tax=Helianthus annuus TaxID=4232 RepID=A0A251SZR2_HELAN|nr:hypothetical protein HanXRQr2_Chr12g0527651 [Helianthus annuus]KAJ0488402.1 hypothetical protein HanHA300_Chr12g0432521 [Helianthus annuus]KAJ0491901.1 hypothetical protein HanIR_Chr12g0568911 [Helianthus annuus]KAJ0504244.1 hypothetical protein HanHA89_Chr12g0457161 [Helianthus annuus]KAJ0673951.1 hypothetical protein HanLR1_Chr12g0434631 [Helianthus annuus]
MVMCRALLKHLNPKKGSKVNTIDCFYGCVDDMCASEFFIGYTKGIWHDDSRPVMLKLKDFPPNHSYEEVLPRHYDEFICALPLREYTDPKTGVFNISAAKLPPHINKPDMGPKSYIAYGNTQELGRGEIL